MNSKTKSTKIAIGKVLFGMAMVVCLMTVFAFDRDELTQTETGKAKSEKVRGKVYEQVEQMPVFQGGESELRNFIGSSVKYPVEAMKNKIQGKVFVGFIIAKNGSVRNVKIVRGADPMLDAEALRVVSSMPKWIPGEQKGKNVAVQYTIPINFALK
jgi:protein TonB